MNSELRKKLDPKRELCILVGYFEISKAFGLYNPKTHSSIFRDVIFDEGGVYGYQKI